MKVKILIFAVVALLALSWAFAGREDISSTYIAAELIIVLMISKEE